MPIYEYECKQCGSTFEKIVKNDSVKVNCVECDSKKVEKQLSVFAAGSSSSSSDCPASSVCPSGGGCSGGGCPMSGM